MTRSDHPDSAEDYVLAAAEAGSGALRSLEVAVGAAVERGQEQRLQRALDLLRAALAELRSSALASPVSVGFVLPAPGDPGATGPDGQAPAEAAISKLARR